jgi:hypothetical protein
MQRRAIAKTQNAASLADRLLFALEDDERQRQISP